MYLVLVTFLHFKELKLYCTDGKKKDEYPPTTILTLTTAVFLVLFLFLNLKYSFKFIKEIILIVLKFI